MDDQERDKRGRIKAPRTSNPVGRGKRFFLDAGKLADFLEAVEVFGSITEACKYVGVNVSVVTLERKRNPEFDAIMSRAKLAKHFKIKKQIVEAGLQGVKKTKGRTTPDWRPLAWILERENPERYGRKDPNAVTLESVLGLTNALVDDLLPLIPPERLEEARAKTSARIGDFGKSMKPADPDDEIEAVENQPEGPVDNA